MSSRMTEMAQNLFETLQTQQTPTGHPPLNAEHAQRTVERLFQPLSEYVNTVVQFEITVPMLRMRFEGDDFKDRFARVDHNRHIAHDTAISSCTQLQTMAEHYNIPSCLPELGTTDVTEATNNPNVRSMVADFCGQYVLETFMNRDGRNTVQYEHTLDMAQEPHLDEAVAAADRQPYTQRIPLRTDIDVSHIKAADMTQPGLER